jgi:CubicO group peptidase (beta-lactamase class C family)
MPLRVLPTLALLLALPAAGAAQVPAAWSEVGLQRVLERLDSIGTAAFVLVTAGETVVSWGQTQRPYRMHSIRKSLLSALVGISVERGELSTSASLEDLGINDKDLLTPIERSATVEQLLASRSGVYHPAASETREAIESRPSRGAFGPGEHWYYNNWDFNTLGTIFGSARGQTVGDAFRDHIARPIGMRDFEVDRHFEYQLEPHRSRHPSYRFRLSARDLALFGQLYLQSGSWGGEQVVPSEWVARSTRATSHLEASGTKGGYGLMWWVTGPADPMLPPGSFTASGAGGQRLTVLPSIETVVVHLMNTDLEDGPRIGSGEYDSLLRLLMSARIK